MAGFRCCQGGFQCERTGQHGGAGCRKEQQATDDAHQLLALKAFHFTCCFLYAVNDMVLQAPSTTHRPSSKNSFTSFAVPGKRVINLPSRSKKSKTGVPYTRCSTLKAFSVVSLPLKSVTGRPPRISTGKIRK